jgi:hypothetical protein
MPQAQHLVLLAESLESFSALLSPLIAEAFAANQHTQIAAPDPLLSKEDVCREFGISNTTLTEWMKKGFMPYLRYDRRVYFERSAVLEAGRRHTKYQHS